jgi:hypothetical protein
MIRHSLSMDLLPNGGRRLTLTALDSGGGRFWLPLWFAAASCSRWKPATKWLRQFVE